MLVWVFWAAAVGITLSVMALLLQTLRHTKNDAASGPNADAALRVYRDQLAEVDRDLAREVISPVEAARVKTEVSRRLLDADRHLQAAPAAPTGSLAPAIALIAVVLAAALAGYFWLGAPGYSDFPLQDRLALAEATYNTRASQVVAEAAAPAAKPVAADPEMLDLIAKLRGAVASRPDDQQGLALLANNEALLGNFIASRIAMQHLVELKAGAATVDDHLTLARTMIAAAGGFISPQAEAQLVAALRLDPENGLARYYSGLMFAQVGRPDRTFNLWAPLLRKGPDTAEWIAPIRATIAEVALRAGVHYTLPALRGPSAEDIAAAGDLSDADRAGMINAMVAQLETRLGTEGGPVEDWAKLITSLAVLDQTDHAKAIYAEAIGTFAANPAARTILTTAAKTAGIEP